MYPGFCQDYGPKVVQNFCIIAPAVVFPVLNHAIRNLDTTSEVVAMSALSCFVGAIFGWVGFEMGSFAHLVKDVTLSDSHPDMDEQKGSRIVKAFSAATYCGVLGLGFATLFVAPYENRANVKDTDHDVDTHMKIAPPNYLVRPEQSIDLRY